MTTVVHPAAQVPSFILRLHALTGDIGQPARQACLPALGQGHHHSGAGCQMAALRPGHRLTQPRVQGIVEEGVFHSVHGFEWYLSLERWLSLDLFNLHNHSIERLFGSQNQLLSVKYLVDDSARLSALSWLKKGCVARIGTSTSATVMCFLRCSTVAGVAILASFNAGLMAGYGVTFVLVTGLHSYCTVTAPWGAQPKASWAWWDSPCCLWR